MTECRIKFDEIQNKTIFSGQSLRGTVELTLNKETKTGPIYIRLSGKTVYKKEQGRRTTKKKKRLFDTEIPLAGTENYSEFPLSAGYHQYQFEFLLPADSPSTIVAEYGYTNYKVRIYYRHLIKQKKACEEVIVVRPVDLNATPSLRMPLASEVSKAIAVQFVPFIHSSGKVEIKARAPMTGYAPYQTIYLEIFINNKSNKAISHFEVKLVKHVKCFLRGFAEWATVKDFDETTLAEIKEQGCEVLKEKEIRANICVPGTQPTDVTSDMIWIYYSIQVIGVVPLPYKNIVLDLPITIGSTPLTEK